jgi:hypothetical protein
MLTSPLKFAVSGDVPAHSWVSAPCEGGYSSMRIINLLNESSGPVNNSIASGKRLEDSLSRKA